MVDRRADSSTNTDVLPMLTDANPGFDSVMRGYDRAQVDSYLARLDADVRAANTERDAAIKQIVATIDKNGVGGLMKLGIAGGRKTRPDIKLGICGEHGGDPASIAFCESTGLDYVSASPYRVPIARLAAAQAALRT